MRHLIIRRIVGFVFVLHFAAGCALRQPTVSRSHEAALGMGGIGRQVTGTEYSDDAHYGAGAAVVWRASYAHCLDKGDSSVCFEIPIDGIPVSTITSPNPRAPQSYSTLTFTPGVRLESHELPGGFLPLNFISVGIGAARYESSDVLLNGTTAVKQRTTTVAVRVDLGLSVRLRKRMGLRVGVFGSGGEEPEWFQRLDVLPATESVPDGRFGGYGVIYLRR